MRFLEQYRIVLCNRLLAPGYYFCEAPRCNNTLHDNQNFMNTTKWTSTIRETTQLALSLFGHLNAEQLNWKPDAQTWSIAQNLHHLITVNESYPPAIAAIREARYRPPFLGKFAFMQRFFGNFVLGSVQKDRKRKMKTFPIWEPSQSHLPADICAQFRLHQDALSALIEGCVDLLEQGAVISSPANRNIVYKLETAFDIIVAHEQRHVEQARALLTQIPAA